jgi:hypothetical protein
VGGRIVHSAAGGLTIRS